MTSTVARPAHPPGIAVDAAVRSALAEDLLPLGDLTSALLPDQSVAEATLVSRADGVLAGRRCVDATFSAVDDAVDVAWEADDGAVLTPGTTVATVTGPLSSVLTAERTALNFAGHLSGIATLTSRFVAAVGDDGPVVWDTRKTTPGLRALEKAAVRAGGGASHRGNLSEWVMLKDNHLTQLPIADAVTAARQAWPGRTVHVECDTLDQAVSAASAGADALLLDNMTPDQVTDAVAAARGALDGRRCLIEASGGITLETAADYAATGIDALSVGALTNSAPVLDLAMDITPGGAP